MLPLSLANVDEELVIKKVQGLPEVRLHIKELGITEGSIVRLVNKTGDNLIVQVKETRLAISSEIARKIYV